MAMASPPRVIVLMDRPARWKAIAVARIEIGMAVSEITVVRTFRRNANSTMATTTMASTRTRSTLAMEVSMKFAWRNRTWSALIPFGRVAVTSFRAASISRVSFTVSMSGCFSTETMTAGLPMKPPSPRFTLGANETSATWRR